MVTESLVSNNSALSQWYRVQGRTYTSCKIGTPSSPSKKFTSNIIPLPELLLNNHPVIARTQSVKKSKSLKSRLSIFSGLGNYQNSLDNSNPDSEDSEKQIEKSNLFLTRCIDDVIKFNEPGTQIYNAPKEMTYVHDIPYLKYVTVGGGYIWQIEIKKVKGSRKKMQF